MRSLIIASLATLALLGCATIREPGAEETPPDAHAIDQCDPETAEAENRECVDVFYGTNRRKMLTKNGEECDQQAIHDRDSGCVGKTKRQDRNYDRNKLYVDMGDLFDIAPDPACEPVPKRTSETNKHNAADKLYGAITYSRTLCHLGVIKVSVPLQKRKPGDKIKKFDQAQSVSAKQAGKKFWIAHHKSLDDRAFKDAMRRVIESNDNSTGHAIVYIHGFNVKFRNAAFRTAQLRHDMQFNGPVMFYSWPANGSTVDYLSDQTDGDLSVDSLASFLKYAHESVNQNPKKPTKLHIIAHSMGTRLTSQALNKLNRSHPSLRFGKVSYAAADIDTKLFLKWMKPALQNIESLTIYTSNFDGAVRMGNFLRRLDKDTRGKEGEDKFRLGYFKKGELPFIWSDQRKTVSTIDISSVQHTSMWGWLDVTRFFVDNHSIFAQNLLVTDDILKNICTGGLPKPDTRSHYMVELATPAGSNNTYWELDPTKAKRYDLVSARNGCRSFHKRTDGSQNPD